MTVESSAMPWRRRQWLSTAASESKPTSHWQPGLLKPHSCRWCQRETGASFALNAMIETDRLKLVAGEVEWTTVPSESGTGQSIARCPKCRIAVWSIYLSNSDHIKQHIRIVRVGTLDTPDALPPDVHIWISEKQPWIVLSDKVPAYPEQNYVQEDVWSEEGLARRRKVDELKNAP